MNKYKAILFSLDGDYVTDARNKASVDEVWDEVNDMGSRWIFYPLPCVIVDKGAGTEARQEIVATFDGGEFLQGVSIKTARNLIEANADYLTAMLT